MNDAQKKTINTRSNFPFSILNEPSYISSSNFKLKGQRTVTFSFFRDWNTLCHMNNLVCLALVLYLVKVLFEKKKKKLFKVDNFFSLDIFYLYLTDNSSHSIENFPPLGFISSKF